MPEDMWVLGLDEFNREMLRTIPESGGYRFHGLLDRDQIVRSPRYDATALLREAGETLRSAAKPPAGLFTYWDFPFSTMAPILCREFGLPSPSLESVLRCEHKYWSRMEQREVIPELVPRVSLLHPFEQRSTAGLDVPYPFWLKPVRSHSSYLGFKVEDGEDLEHALRRTREGLSRVAEPFNQLLLHADLPAEIEEVDGYHCIAEEIVSAESQCTLEGYVFDGEPHVYGIVDSIRAGQGSSFARYQYPSQLPASITDRMIDAADRVMRHIGFDGGAFNMEFFYEQGEDRIRLLEINSRVSKSHFPLFAMVDGVANVHVAVQLAAGRRPTFPQGHPGSFRVAAKFMMRHFRDAVVRKVPSEEDVSRVGREVPGTYVQTHVRPGQRLSSLPNQDSYSYEYAVVFVGGCDQAELETKYRRCLEILDFEFADTDRA